MARGHLSGYTHPELDGRRIPVVDDLGVRGTGRAGCGSEPTGDMGLSTVWLGAGRGGSDCLVMD